MHFWWRLPRIAYICVLGTYQVLFGLQIDRQRIAQPVGQAHPLLDRGAHVGHLGDALQQARQRGTCGARGEACVQRAHAVDQLLQRALELLPLGFAARQHVVEPHDLADQVAVLLPVVDDAEARLADRVDDASAVGKRVARAHRQAAADGAWRVSEWRVRVGLHAHQAELFAARHDAAVFIIITITIIKTKERARRRGKQSVLTGHRGATHSFTHSLIHSFTYRSIKR